MIPFAFTSVAGRRGAKNQDTVLAEVPERVALLHAKGALFVVADGMGGHQGGGVASRLAARTVIDQYYRNPRLDPAQSLGAAVRTADGWLRYWARQRPDLRGMGTTLTAVVVVGRNLYVAHVGDSRAYLLRGQQVWRLTQDETWVAGAVRRGLLTPKEAAHHPWRNVLEGYLGGSGVQTLKVVRYSFRPGDRLLLCTDGVTDWIRGREFGWMMGNGLDRTTRSMVKLARRRGSQDDASVIIVDLRLRDPSSYHNAWPGSLQTGRSPVSAASMTGKFALTASALTGMMGLMLLLVSALGGF